MRNLAQIRWFNFLLSTILMSFLLSACTTDPEEEPPDIPPESTFIMDYSAFGGSATTSDATILKTQQQSEVLSNQNWTHAAFKVGFWNTVITLHLAIPVAAFRHALMHKPELQDDGTWVWSYEFNALFLQHTAELHGKIVDDAIDWKMYISRQGSFTDFLWYTGTSKLNGTEGTWELNQNPQDPNPYIGILWHLNSSTGTADIKYTNIIPDGAENGGYIFYGITNDITYNRFYDIYNKGAENHTDIEWHALNQNGRIKDPAFYKDSEWHGWDMNQEDI